MSRWSRDRLRIALAPHALALVRHQGSAEQPVASKSIACDTRDWQSLMLLLEAELTDAVWHAPRVEVVLSNHFVRYVITPPSGKALKQSEETALVSASLREIYGAEANEWRIRVHSQPPEYGLVGAAIDERLATRLDEILARVGLTHWHLQPLTTLASQQSNGSVDWWVLSEPGWVCVFHAVAGYWRYLSAQAVDANWPNALPEMLDREARMAGLSRPAGKTQTVLIQTIGLSPITPPATTGWHWQMAKPTTDERGAMALAMA
ncbi:MAG: hypothetical protein ACYC4K_08865 [Thiobacillus sp.]